MTTKDVKDRKEITAIKPEDRTPAQIQRLEEIAKMEDEGNGEEEISDFPTKEQWKASIALGSFDGIVKFITPPTDNVDTRTVTLSVDDDGKALVKEILEEAMTAGVPSVTLTSLIYGVKATRSKVIVKVHKALLEGIKTGDELSIGVEGRMANQTTYWNRKFNGGEGRAEFHQSSGVFLAETTQFTNERDLENEERYIKMVTSAETDNKMALATLLSGKFK